MGFSDFFFLFDMFFSHKQKFLGSKQAPRYTGKRVILMRVLTRLECSYTKYNMTLVTSHRNDVTDYK